MLYCCACVHPSQPAIITEHLDSRGAIFMSKQPLIPEFGKKVKLKNFDPDYTSPYATEDDAQEQLEKDLDDLSKLQNVLYAEAKRSVLIVLQGIDTGGKDGTIKHVFRGLNPQGVKVVSFKQPTVDELAHDYLWRIHKVTPPNGYIGVFNRSHYEDVLIVRVHELVPEKVWKQRYAQINDFEEMLTDNGMTILKFFLYISKDEQKRRLEARLEKPHKEWKFSKDDLKERELWDDYMDAYEDMLSKCNTEVAPWHVIPGNQKWYRNIIITRTIV